MSIYSVFLQQQDVRSHEAFIQADSPSHAVEEAISSGQLYLGHSQTATAWVRTQSGLIFSFEVTRQ